MKKVIISLGILALMGGGMFVASNSFMKNDILQENKPAANNMQVEEEKYVYEATVTADVGPTDPKYLYEYSELVLIADYQKDIATKIYSNGNPYTTSEFKVDKILKNENDRKIADKIQARYLGGIVTIEELLKTKDNDFIKKIGADTMTKEQKTATKIKYSTEDIGDSSLKEHSKRILFINYNPTTDDYIIVADQYGMVSYDNNTIFNTQTKQRSNYSFLK